MPRGPRGEKRPADVIGNAVKVMRIATGEETETLPPRSVRRRFCGARLFWRFGCAAAVHLQVEIPRREKERRTPDRRAVTARLGLRRYGLMRPVSRRTTRPVKKLRRTPGGAQSNTRRPPGRTVVAPVMWESPPSWKTNTARGRAEILLECA